MAVCSVFAIVVTVAVGAAVRTRYMSVCEKWSYLMRLIGRLLPDVESRSVG